MHWDMIASLVGGTVAMRAAGEKYLPRWPKETEESYAARKRTAVLFPAFTRTAAVLAAKPFARPLRIESTSIPARVADMLTDVDMFGTDLQPFAAQIMTACLQYGLIGVLVDHPPTSGRLTVKDEKAAGVRPYVTTYPAQAILGWRARRSGGKSVLTQLRLLETVEDNDGPWGTKEVPQVRILTPGGWETWRKVDDDEWAMFASGVTSLGRIPFVFFYGDRKSFGVGAPPLVELAYQNVEHWQSASDQQSILHVARVPILFAKGFSTSDSLVVGAASAATAQSKDAELRYVEHTGKSIEAGRVSLLDLEARMRQTGAELLVQRSHAVTATEVRGDAEGNRSTLQKIVEDFEESLEEVVRLMAEWVGEACEPEIDLFKEFGASAAADISGDLILRGRAEGVLSAHTAFEEFKRLDVIAPDASWDEEERRLKAESPKGEEPVVVENPAQA